MRRCLRCFNEYDEHQAVCPYCKCDQNLMPARSTMLRPGTVLHNRYIIGESIGDGGFGIIYRAYDNQLETVIAIKEFFMTKSNYRTLDSKTVSTSEKPNDQAEFAYRKKRFVDEARCMARFRGNMGIPQVYEVFDENNTSYIAMELLEGQSLSAYLKALPENRADLEFTSHVIYDVAEALSLLHRSGVVHCDVAPDNIFLSSKNGENRVILLDLGIAKLSKNENDVQDVTVKNGYSPIEQYQPDKSYITAATDVYALAATIYVMLSGSKLPSAKTRAEEDTLPALNSVNSLIPQNVNDAVMKGLSIYVAHRFHSVEELIRAAGFRSAEEDEKDSETRGRLSGLEEKLNKVLSGNTLSSQSEKLLAAAKAKLKAKDYNGALESLNYIVQTAPDFAEAYWTRLCARYHVTPETLVLCPLDLTKDSDYSCAYQFASDEKKKEYERIVRTCKYNLELNNNYRTQQKAQADAYNSFKVNLAEIQEKNQLQGRMNDIMAIRNLYTKTFCASVHRRIIIAFSVMFVLNILNGILCGMAFNNVQMNQMSGNDASNLVKIGVLLLLFTPALINLVCNIVALKGWGVLTGFASVGIYIFLLVVFLFSESGEERFYAFMHIPDDDIVQASVIVKCVLIDSLISNIPGLVTGILMALVTGLRENKYKGIRAEHERLYLRYVEVLKRIQGYMLQVDQGLFDAYTAKKSSKEAILPRISNREFSGIMNRLLDYYAPPAYKKAGKTNQVRVPQRNR